MLLQEDNTTSVEAQVRSGLDKQIWGLQDVNQRFHDKLYSDYQVEAAQCIGLGRSKTQQ